MTSPAPQVGKVAWKVKEWSELVSLSQSYVHKLIGEKKINSKRVGHTRLITTSPKEFIDGIADDIVEDDLITATVKQMMAAKKPEPKQRRRRRLRVEPLPEREPALAD